MKLEKVSALAEITSSVAILVTLVFLTVETRQNTNALNAQTRQTILSSSQSELFMLFQNPDVVTALTRPGPLTPEENIKIDTFYTAAMRAREFSWLQYQNHLIDQSQWNSELAVIRSLLGGERARLWWERLGHSYVSAEFAEFVNQLIQKTPVGMDDWALSQSWSIP